MIQEDKNRREGNDSVLDYGFETLISYKYLLDRSKQTHTLQKWRLHQKIVVISFDTDKTVLYNVYKHFIACIVAVNISLFY